MILLFDFACYGLTVHHVRKHVLIMFRVMLSSKSAMYFSFSWIIE